MRSKSNLVLATSVLVVLGLCGPALADELLVPDEYLTIQAAINAAVDSDVVIVADGTYTGTGNKNLDFGGRAITVRSENGPQFTIIDCENDGRAFFFHTGEDENAIVAGFTITRGSSYRGGGIRCDNSSPNVRNCVLRYNTTSDRGGGIYCSGSSMVLSECKFIENTADVAGGGLHSNNSTLEISDCEFLNNSTVGYSSDGGGFDQGNGSNCTITNCLFAGNSCPKAGAGAGIRNYNASGTLINCSFTGNSARYGAVHNSPTSSPIYINCILWGNSGYEIYNNGDSHPMFSYCDIEGGWNGPKVRNRGGSSVIDGGGNINADSQFVSGPLGDYYLSQIIAGQSSDSPCVDAGSDLAINLSLANFTTRTDSIGDSGIVDMGYHYPAVTRAAIDIKPGSCPNPLNVKSLGVLPVAVLGSEDFDVSSIDVASIRLAGVAPIRSSYEDVATPVSDSNECECSTEGPDGFPDLTLKFENR
ncbi:MAG: right-handed parallel beta-helix repeat-containing protein [Planctomycetota bacterium]|jgi:hypothetical protein